MPTLVTKDAVVAAATPNVLASMQAQRTSAGRKHRRFDTVAQAEAWLAEMREAK